MMTPARLSWCVSMMASVSARSLNGATRTCSSMACGMPAESGVGAGKALGAFGPTLISE